MPIVKHLLFKQLSHSIVMFFTYFLLLKHHKIYWIAQLKKTWWLIQICYSFILLGNHCKSRWKLFKENKEFPCFLFFLRIYCIYNAVEGYNAQICTIWYCFFGEIS